MVDSLITGVAVIIAAAIGACYHKLTQIHVLVNSRLDTAIAEIEDLKKQRDIKRDDDAK